MLKVAVDFPNVKLESVIAPTSVSTTAQESGNMAVACESDVRKIVLDAPITVVIAPVGRLLYVGSQGGHVWLMSFSQRVER